MSVIEFNLNDHPHRRFNPLSREWVLVSPHRAQRPWQGQLESPSPEPQITYDPDCYLCPGNARAGGVLNPAYQNTFVFDNDFAALKSVTPAGEINERDLIRAESESGTCRVICFSPRHDLTIARMTVEDLTVVVENWCAQFSELGQQSHINYVQIFENRGAMMGASNPHPHGQIWASSSIPNEVQKELQAQQEYYAIHRVSLLSDYLKLERQKQERIVCENEHFVALVPFWAVWPFEVMVISQQQVAALDELSGAEQIGLADILKQVTTRYDNLFQVSFPYTMGFHQRPSDGRKHPEFHFHAHFYPPLLRSATVRKFMVGYEMLGTPQRDITAEIAAARLREMPATHYLAS